MVAKRAIFGNVRMAARRPTFLHEREFIAAGYAAIVGVDEAGTGAFARPIVAGAVILPPTSAWQIWMTQRRKRWHLAVIKKFGFCEAHRVG